MGWGSAGDALVAVGEHAVADDLSLVADVFGADQVQRRRRDQRVQVVSLAMAPQDRREFVPVESAMFPTTSLGLLIALESLQGASSTGSRSRM